MPETSKCYKEREAFGIQSLLHEGRVRIDGIVVIGPPLLKLMYLLVGPLTYLAAYSTISTRAFFQAVVNASSVVRILLTSLRRYPLLGGVWCCLSASSFQGLHPFIDSPPWWCSMRVPRHHLNRLPRRHGDSRMQDRVVGAVQFAFAFHFDRRWCGGGKGPGRRGGEDRTGMEDCIVSWRPGKRSSKMWTFELGLEKKKVWCCRRLAWHCGINEKTVLLTEGKGILSAVYRLYIHISTTSAQRQRCLDKIVSTPRLYIYGVTSF